MCVTTAVFGLLMISSLTLGQSRDCTSKADQGIICSTHKPELRYYFDTTIGTCLPFLYKGCGGNNNNYASSSFCTSRCVKLDFSGCSLGKASTGSCNSNGLTCPEGSVCRFGAFSSGVCCDSETEAQLNNEWRPKCKEGKTLIKKNTSAGWQPFIGRKCSHEFCPTGSNCVQGKYLAHCCE